MQSKTVAMIVLNSVSHDARVKKMAESLSGNGFKVFIVGVQDNRESRPSNTLPNGTTIIRIEILKYKKLFNFLSHFFNLICIFTFLLIINNFLFNPAIVETGIKTKNIYFLDYALIITISLLFSSVSYIGLLKIKLVFKNRRNNSIKNGQNFSLKRSSFGFLGKSIKYFRESLKHLIFIIDTLKKFFYRVLRRYIIKILIIKKVLKIKPYFIHCHDLPTLPIGNSIKRITGCKLIYDSHEIFEHISQLTKPQRLYYRIIQKKYSKYVDHFITINHSIEKYLNQSYPNLPKGIVIKNASPYCENLPPYDGRLHKKTGFDPKMHILLYQGGFSRYRGLETLVRSAPLLKDGWGIVMMGWGSIEEELKKIAVSIDPHKRKIRFISGAPQNELVNWTQGASIGIIPYENICLNHWYCTPNKLWEYPNAGVPIIASALPEMKKTIIENNIGWLIKVDFSYKEIADTVNCISEKDFKIKKGNCRKFVSNDNWIRYETSLLNVYNNYSY